MRDKSEKYLLIAREFPNKAGKLRQLLETQKRITIELARTKQPDSVTKLLLSVAESYDVGIEMLDWTYKVLQGVATDSEALVEGSKLRNMVEDQSKLIQDFMNREDELLIKILKKK